MKPLVVLFLLCLVIQTKGIGQHCDIDATLAVAEDQGSLSLSVGRDWRIGKKERFGIGTGIRFTSYYGHDQYYETAPAKLTSGGTGPGVIFVENIAANIDSVKFSSSQLNSFNLFVNLSYQITSKVTVGFNIDAIGFSFGSRQAGTFIHEGVGATTYAKPTPFNILLVSDNDKGTLNSEFYGKYFFSPRWSVKIAAQFLFTEYTTLSQVQQTPELNDRFRNKSLMVAIGAIRKF